MMDDLKNVLKVFTLRRKAPEQCMPAVGHSERDWMILCTIVTAVFFCGIVFDGWVYLGGLTAANENPSVPPARTVGPALSDLNAVLLNYETLGQEYQGLLTRSVSIVDPSKAQ